MDNTDIRNERFIVCGAGKSGKAAVDLLLRIGNTPVLWDGNRDLDIDALREKNPAWKDVQIFAGALPEDVLHDRTACILSPGIPTDIPEVMRMRKAGLQIWGEVELAYRIGKGSVCAITGTNGKTTTTALTGEIMRTHFDDVKVVGNIGTPWTELADQTTEDSVTVAEISSFMLETTDAFHPHVSAILNITPDHLNRHHTMENYIHAKDHITCRQTKEDYCILNHEDPVLRAFGEKECPAEVIWFSSKEPVTPGVYVKDGCLYTTIGGTEEKIIETSALQILGTHNHENACAAAAFGIVMGVPLPDIRKALQNFKAVEHRIEFVCEKRGIRFYNDSKGTNPDAAIKAVDAMDRPTVLIGGGYDKGIPFDEWVSHFKGRVRKLFLIGVTKQAIADACDRAGFRDYEFCDTFEEAIDRAYAAAEPGDAVLLSPACASWDMFKSYEERGRIFKDYVRALQ